MNDHGPILVPLDGSELAEGILPYAAALADALRTHLAIVTVWEGTERDLANFPVLAADYERSARECFDEYHKGIIARLRRDGTTRMVREGDAQDEILKAAEEVDARAIAIATHGRSGFGRWLYGSVAAGILRRSPVPLLVAGPKALGRKPERAEFKHIMVPLDGKELSEAALPVATQLAAKTGARVTLVRAVNWAVQTYPYTLPSAYVPQVDEELEAGAKAYLRRKEDEIRDAVASVDAYVVRGSAADGLLEFADGRGVDLVVMTTHARSGLARAALGSVADRMVQARVPLLLVPPEALA